MVTSNQLLKELPPLRRYARALSGSQVKGDKLVSELLAKLSDDPSALKSGAAMNVALFRAFSDYWNASVGDDSLSQLDPSSHVDQSLASLSSRARQAFLLTSVEEFPADEAATILNTTESDVAELIVQARREISDQTQTNCLIIEDELFIATQLEAIVSDLGHVVLDIVRTRADAVEALKKSEANLIKLGFVLADVQLADGSSGIDAVSDILHSVACPVIFITAFPERLLTSKSVEPTFILSKPFTDDSLKAVVTQALFFRKDATRLT